MFNTLSYARKLEAAGVAREQAEAHVQIIAEIVEGDLATKQDVKSVKDELKDEMEKLEYRLTIKLFALIGAGAATTVTATVAILKLMLAK
jgi:hypothetical protein